VTDKTASLTQPSWESVGRVQWTLVASAIVLFFAAVLRMPSLGLVEAACGSIALGTAYVVAQRRGPSIGPTQEPIAVFLLGFLLLAIPVAAGDPPRAAGFVAAGIGLIAIEMLWAVLRYPAVKSVSPQPKRTLLENLRWGVKWGLGMAIGFSVYVAVLFGVISVGSWHNMFAGATLSVVVAAYFAGGISGGLIAGALRPLGRWPLGKMAMGFLVAIPGYEVFAFAEPMLDTSSRSTPLSEQLSIGLVCALLVGPMVALSVRSRSPLSQSRPS
jgi:hypothetical protein